MNELGALEGFEAATFTGQLSIPVLRDDLMSPLFSQPGPCLSRQFTQFLDTLQPQAEAPCGCSYCGKLDAGSVSGLQLCSLIGIETLPHFLQ